MATQTSHLLISFNGLAIIPLSVCIYFGFQFFNDLLFLYVRQCVGKSDWSEIDQVFSSDDEELFGYFESGSNFRNKA